MKIQIPAYKYFWVGAAILAAFALGRRQEIDLVTWAEAWELATAEAERRRLNGEFDIPRRKPKQTGLKVGKDKVTIVEDEEEFPSPPHMDYNIGAYNTFRNDYHRRILKKLRQIAERDADKVT